MANVGQAAPDTQSDQLSQLINLLKQQQQGQQPSISGGSYATSGNLVTNPLYDLTRLGAAATGQRMVVNPMAGQQQINPKSGVYSGPQTPMVSSTVPSAGQGPWSQVPGVLGGQAQPGSRFAAAGPTVAWNPSVPGGTPIQPATAAPVQTGQSWAAPSVPGQMWAAPPPIQAPPAPSGVPPQFVPAAPTQWGIPGGQPAGLTVQPFMGNVHEDPYTSHAVTVLLGLPDNPWHHPDGTSKAAVALGGGTATPVKRMAGGGYVDDDRRYPPEVPRPMPSSSTGSTSSAPTTKTSLSGQDAATTANNLAKTFSGGGSGNQFSMIQDLARQRLQQQQAIAQAGGSAPGLGQAAQMAWNTGTNPNAGLPVGASGYVNAAGQQIAPTPGTQGYPGMSPTARVGYGVGAIGGAISDAANKWAQSVGSWKPQQSAIPTPDYFYRQQPQVNLQEETT